MTMLPPGELFAFTHAMNERCIDTILRHEDHVPDRALALQGHILNAHHIWLARIAGVPAAHEPWELHLVDAYALLNNRNLEQTNAVLASDDPSRIVHYANTIGQAFSNAVGDILFHVVNHGTHHRAQIASLLRAAGLPPPVLDFIAYKRR